MVTLAEPFTQPSIPDGYEQITEGDWQEGDMFWSTIEPIWNAIEKGSSAIGTSIDQWIARLGPSAKPTAARPLPEHDPKILPPGYDKTPLPIGTKTQKDDIFFNKQDRRWMNVYIANWTLNISDEPVYRRKSVSNHIESYKPKTIIEGEQTW